MLPLIDTFGYTISSMATYKVIQDIEAEDKLVGPLTLRQFIYGAVAGVSLWLSFVSYAKHVPYMMVLFVPIAFLAGFLAVPWGGDQPTEIWAVAKLRFYLKPRKRIWNQDGQKDLVAVTVPKRIERNYTDGLSTTEVRSRLSALADTLDSRGWALQNQPYQVANNVTGERLFSVSTTLPQPVIHDGTSPKDDMMDMQSNPTASHLSEMVDSAAQAQRNALLAHMSNPAPSTPPPTMQNATAPPANDWFSGSTKPQPSPPIAEDKNTSKTTPNNAVAQDTTTLKTQATSTPNTAIMNLAGNNDLDIATLSRQANKQSGLGDDGEVVIPLR